MNKLHLFWRLLRARTSTDWQTLGYDCETRAFEQMARRLHERLRQEETEAEAYGAHLLAQAKQLTQARPT